MAKRLFLNTFIFKLFNKDLQQPLKIIVESDVTDNYYIAVLNDSIDIPIYGEGIDIQEAVNMLKVELESIYNDLILNDNINEDWVNIKKFLIWRIK